MTFQKTANEIRSYVKEAQVGKTLSNMLLGKPWAPAAAGSFAQNSEMWGRLLGAAAGAGAGGALGGIAGSIGTYYNDRMPNQDAVVLLAALAGAGLGGMGGARLAGFSHELSRHFVDSLGGAIPR